MRPWLARSGARAVLLLALLAVVGAATFAVAAIDGRHRADVADAVRTAVTSGAPAPTTRVSGDLAASRDQVALVRRTTRDAPLRTARTVTTSPFTLSTGPRTLRVSALSVDDLPAHARLVAGAWPTTSRDAVHAVLQADAAERIGVVPGDRLRIGDDDIVVDGTWRPRDRDDPVWAGEPSVTSGRGLDGIGPLVVPEGALDRLPVDPTVVTTLWPAPDLAPEDVPRAAAALGRLTRAVDDQQGLTVDGALPDRLLDVETELAAGRVLLVVALAVVVGAAWVTFRQVLTLLAEARTEETRLLRARGGTVAALVGASAVETAVVAGAGAALGSVTARLAVADAPALGAGLTATGVAIVTAATVTARASRQSSTTTPRTPRVPPLLALVCAAAAISVGELLANDSPLSRSSAGRIEVDPVSVLAPGLFLLALCLVGLLLLSPGLRPLERLAARPSGLAPALPVRRLARQLSTYRVAVVVLALATGFAVAAGAVVSTWGGLAQSSSDVVNASDVRVALRLPAAVDASSSEALAPYRGIDVDGRAALTTEGRVESEPIAVVAADADDVTDTAAAAARHLDLRRWSALLRSDEGGTEDNLDDSLDLALGLDGAPEGRVEVAVWLIDDVGRVDREVVAVWLIDDGGRVDREVVADRPADDVDGARARLDVPDGRWGVAAVEASAAGADDSTRVTVDGLPGGAVTVSLDTGRTSARSVVGPLPDELPVVVTPAVSRLVQADVGERFALLLPDTGVTVRVRVVALADALPTVTGSRGLLTDLSTLTRLSLAAGDAVPAPDEMWLPTDRPRQVAAAAGAAGLARGTVSTASPDRAVVSAALDLWGPASAAVAGFALLASAATAAGVLRPRRREMRVLGVLGVRARRQGRHQGLELVGACLASLLLGLAAGAVVAIVTARLLARTAVPGRPPGLAAQLDILVGWPSDVWPSVVVAVLVAGSAAVSWGAARSTARQARRRGTGVAR